MTPFPRNDRRQNHKALRTPCLGEDCQTDPHACRIVRGLARETDDRIWRSAIKTDTDSEPPG